MSHETPFNWRAHLRVHPAADLFPLMSEAELKELAEDINVNGLQASIVLFEENGKNKLLDGRNRLDALALLGRLDVDHDCRLRLIDRHNGDIWDTFTYRSARSDQGLRGCDPYTFVLSANVHRRHLTPEQKRELIAKLLKAKPEASNLAVAKQVKADDKTVAAVRHELEANSEIPNKPARVEASGRKARGRKPGSKPAKKRIRATHPPLDTDDAQEERDRKACIALDQKVKAAERELVDAEASAEARKAAYAADGMSTGASAGALVKFKAAAADLLPLLTANDLKAAREYVASDDWRRGEVPGDLSIPGFLRRDLPARVQP
jgi:hypothetical protein